MGTKFKVPKNKEYPKSNTNDNNSRTPKEYQGNTNGGLIPKHIMKHGVPNGPSKRSGNPNHRTLREEKSFPKMPGHGTSRPPLGKENHFIYNRSAEPIEDKYHQDKEENTKKAIICKTPATKHILVDFKSSHYKEIKHIQEFNVESWIGNMGGYVGLFLGFAIWQVPDLIDLVFKKLKSIVNTMSGV